MREQFTVGGDEPGPDLGKLRAEHRNLRIAHDEESRRKGVGQRGACCQRPGPPGAGCRQTRAGIDKMFTLYGDARAAQRHVCERENALRHTLTDTDGPAAFACRRSQDQGGASAALQAGLGDIPVAEQRGEPVERIALADGTEIQLQRGGM